MEVTKGKEWADVEGLECFNNKEKARNSMPIQDFCKYKHIIYTEAPLPLPFPSLSFHIRKNTKNSCTEGNNLLRPANPAAP
jgi:hypothetical protein